MFKFTKLGRKIINDSQISTRHIQSKLRPTLLRIEDDDTFKRYDETDIQYHGGGHDHGHGHGEELTEDERYEKAMY